MTWIKDLRDGQRFSGQYLVNNMAKGVTATGASYLTISLQDKTGSLDGKLWDVLNEDLDTFAIGNIVEVSGDVLNYRGSLQLKIISGKTVPMVKVDPSQFTMSAPRLLKDMEEELAKIITSIKDKQISLLVDTLIKAHYAAFITYPAATRNHHEYTSGLLYHTLSMVHLAEAIIPMYPTIDRDMLMAGILLHDLGKTIELSGPIIPKYTIPGKLIGHITLMASEILKTAPELGIEEEKATLIAHMVISHHGKQEFGSPVIPLTREAFLLSLIDDMDAKLVMMDKALEGIEAGDFSTRIYTLDDRTLYQPKNGKK